MVENALLAVASSCVGLIIANVLSRSLVAFLETQGGPLHIDLRPDGKLIAFSTCVTAVCCAAFGLLPCWRVTGGDAADALKTSSRVTATRSGAALRQVLVVAQVTLSLILVFGALLFTRTLKNVLGIDAGFQYAHVLVAEMDYSRLNVPASANLSFGRELLETIRRTPGVSAAAASDVVPLSGNGGSSRVWLKGSGREKGIDANTHFIGDGYMATMGVRLLAGREFDGRDRLASPRAAIINREFARQMGIRGNPIGRYFRKEASPWKPEATFEIVGLVSDTKYFSLKEALSPIAYYSIDQDKDRGPSLQVFIRSQTSGTELAATLHKKLKEKYPGIGFETHNLEATVRDGLLRERLLATVSGFFGMLAVLIAAVGLYGVISYMVVRRTNEIGIRMALGASQGRIIQAVISRAALLVTIGIVAGVVTGMIAAQAVRSMLFGVQPYDLATLAVSALSLVAVAVAASLVPALRAVRLDPMSALRSD